MTGTYTVAAICAPLAVVAVELGALRTGILRRGRFWATIAIVLAFQVAVDGWLTKLSAPIVIYRRTAICGVRWPDFRFQFVTAPRRRHGRRPQQPRRRQQIRRSGARRCWLRWWTAPTTRSSAKT